MNRYGIAHALVKLASHIGGRGVSTAISDHHPENWQHIPAGSIAELFVTRPWWRRWLRRWA